MRLTIKITVQLPAGAEIEIFRSDLASPADVTSTLAIAQKSVCATLAAVHVTKAVIRGYLGPALLTTMAAV
jgi:hypothetical protein